MPTLMKVPKLLAVALPMVLMSVLPAPAQVPSPPEALIGTMTMLQDAGQIGGKAAPQPYAVSLAVPDTGKEPAEAQAPAVSTRADISPIPSEDGKPGWRKHALVEAPVDGCEGIKPGKKPRPACADRPTTASLVANSGQAHRRPEPGPELHRQAQSTPEARRVLNVIYTSLARLGKTNRR